MNFELEGGRANEQKGGEIFLEGGREQLLLSLLEFIINSPKKSVTSERELTSNKIMKWSFGLCSACVGPYLEILFSFVGWSTCVEVIIFTE